MKTKLPFFILAIVLLLSCSKDDAADVVDCAGDALFTIVDHDASENNPREITFTVLHGDNPSIRSISWNFGDNTTQSSDTNTITHTYAQPGTYHVSLTVNLTNSCSFDKTKSVTVH